MALDLDAAEHVRAERDRALDDRDERDALLASARGPREHDELAGDEERALGGLDDPPAERGLAGVSARGGASAELAAVGHDGGERAVELVRRLRREPPHGREALGAAQLRPERVQAGVQRGRAPRRVGRAEQPPHRVGDPQRERELDFAYHVGGEVERGALRRREDLLVCAPGEEALCGHARLHGGRRDRHPLTVVERRDAQLVARQQRLDRREHVLDAGGQAVVRRGVDQRGEELLQPRGGQGAPPREIGHARRLRRGRRGQRRRRERARHGLEIEVFAGRAHGSCSGTGVRRDDGEESTLARSRSRILASPTYAFVS